MTTGIIPDPTKPNPAPESLVPSPDNKPPKKQHKAIITTLVFFGNVILVFAYFAADQAQLFLWHLLALLVLGLVIKQEAYRRAFLFTFAAFIIIIGIGIGGLYIYCATHPFL